ncbi:GNAT family N-acetyltransferase [Rhizobiaceae bacterium BDR2-2]|uniref:GNAT family N-acetyltransferase n=1 Tax=Ectorhizobium quercum TaxID=2965071 RepID=A0AAE3N255_9HYPH|nr:GNAT family N-acetyltransferase [Ectorhizobium quercum]MCX8999169.1 GNAT family N-acetyltransferase [Ectorhizobium quercum]
MAGQAFLSVPEFEWVAGDDVQSEERHAELIAGGTAWVAVDDRDVPVGFLNAQACPDALHILELSVRADQQGRGFGRRLVAQAIAAARRSGFPAVTLTTFRDVPWSRPFYERMGFRVPDEDETPARLRKILDEEAAHGLRRETRCAMLLDLTPPPPSPRRRPGNSPNWR